MDCAKKTLIFLTFCALVGAKRFEKIKKNLEIVVSVPSTHIGDTEIESAVFTVTPTNPFLYEVAVQKNETQCINSTNPLCTSLIKEPTVVVSVSLRASNGKSFTYSDSINGSLWLKIQVDPEFSVRPQIVDGERDGIIVKLDMRYDTGNTSRDSLSSRRRPTIFSLDAEFTTTTTMIIEEDDGQGNGQENGQSALRCGPLSALILLALLPVLLLK